MGQAGKGSKVMCVYVFPEQGSPPRAGPPWAGRQAGKQRLGPSSTGPAAVSEPRPQRPTGATHGLPEAGPETRRAEPHHPGLQPSLDHTAQRRVSGGDLLQVTSLQAREAPPALRVTGTSREAVAHPSQGDTEGHTLGKDPCWQVKFSKQEKTDSLQDVDKVRTPVHAHPELGEEVTKSRPPTK